MTVETREQSENGTAEQPDFLIEARVTHGRGRYLVGSEAKVLVTDSAGRPGGSGAFGATELLLSSLASCLLGNIERHAADQRLSIGGGTVATLTAVRNEVDHTVFKSVHIEVFIDGVSQAQAEDFVTKYTDTCPIYNTVRRGGPLSIEVVSEHGRRTLADNIKDWS